MSFSLKNKKILLGITGSISAYKSAFLVRLLVKEGAEVQVVLSPYANEFVTPLTLSTLSKRPVFTDFIKNDLGEWSNHVDLALWADLLVIAPASANTLAKMSNGLCDNLLLACFLSAKCQVIVAPAMDLDMYANSATKRNLRTLAKDDVTILSSPSGELASGLLGEGRMAEPEDILLSIKGHFKKKRLTGKKVLVTAGPTREALDPVRFLSNKSTGTMGIRIANALSQEGAEVILICGPCDTTNVDTAISLINIESAEEMYAACSNEFGNSNILIMAAAVADYKPASYSDNKIKKKTGENSLELSRTKDILFDLGHKKTKGQFIIGFAMETENALANAKKKLKSKNADAIVLNSLVDAGAGFGKSTNKISIVDSNKVEHFELKEKSAVAVDIVNYICDNLHS